MRPKSLNPFFAFAVAFLIALTPNRADAAAPTNEQGLSIVEIVHRTDVVMSGEISSIRVVPTRLPDECDTEISFASVTVRGPKEARPWKTLGPAKLLVPAFSVPLFMDLKAGSEVHIFLGPEDASGRRLPVGGAAGVFVVRHVNGIATVVNGEANNGLWRDIEALHGGSAEPWWKTFLERTRESPDLAAKSDQEIADLVRSWKQRENKLQVRLDVFLSMVHALSPIQRG